MQKRKIEKITLTFIPIIFIFLSIIFIALIYYSNSIKLKNDQLNLFEKPNPKYKYLGKTKKNERFKILKKSNNWLKIKSYNQNTKGWITSWNLKNDKKEKENGKIADATIVLDPGHGGKDTGTLALQNTKKRKYFEKTYTLEIAKTVKKFLEKMGARVILTRDKDRSLYLAKRTHISKKNRANIFISFHFNHYAIDNGASGVQTFYYHKKIGNSYKLAKIIDKNFNNLPLKNRGTTFGNFYVIRETVQPSILLEMGYMNNKRDLKIIREKKYQKKIATDISQTLKKWFN